MRSLMAPLRSQWQASSASSFDNRSFDSATTCVATIPARKAISTLDDDSNRTKMSNKRRKESSQRTSESSRIRSRYLDRLGVGKPKVAPMPSSKPKVSTSNLETLKQDRGKTDDSLTIHSPPQHARPTVSFRSSVVVHSIPNRQEYSERVKKTIWMQPEELEESANRNCIEFSAEGWDWRQAIEETDFVFFRGDLIHPAHMARQCNLQRQFLMIMSAQQRHKQRFL
jgi:hypothetical protein